jgi:hypothetical protein
MEGRNDFSPSLNVGNDIDHVFLEALLIIVPGPPAATVEVDEVRTPTFRKT